MLAVVLASIPLILFLADQVVSRIRLTDISDIRHMLTIDTRPVIRELAEHHAVLNVLTKYAYYTETIRFIFHTLIITIIAALSSNFSCTHDVMVFSPIHLLVLFVLSIAIVTFLVMIFRKKIAAPSVLVAVRWKRFVLAISLLVILVEVLRVSADHLPLFLSRCM